MSEIKWNCWQQTEDIRWKVTLGRLAQAPILQQKWQRVGIRQPETDPLIFEVEYEWRGVPTHFETT